MPSAKAWPLRVSLQTACVTACAWLTLNAAYLVQSADQMRTPPPWLSWIASRGGFFFGPEAGVLSIEDYCPLGPLEGAVRFVQSLVSGQGVSFVGPVTLRNLGVLLAVVVLVGLTKKTCCSWLCPFGAVFEAVSWAGKRIGISPWRPPRRWDFRLRRGRHLMLAALVVLTASAGTLIFKPVDPFFALFSIGTGAAALSAFAVLAVLLLGALFLPGIWCHYLCPLGGALDPISRLGPIRVTRNQRTCTHCATCSRACPQAIPVAKRDRVTDARCTNCLRCLDACPEADTLQLQLSLRK